MDQTDNYSTDYISSGYYQQLVEAKMKCNQLLTQFDSENDMQIQNRFKQYLSFLARELVPKYQRRKDKEVPDKIKDLDKMDLTGLDMRECRNILNDFNDLIEKLGIVSKANHEYELKEKGAVKKE